MATGQLPFRGDSTATIFEAILNRTPVPVVRLNPDLPLKLEDVITKALEKDRNLRYQHASDMRADLQRLKRDTTSGGPLLRRRRKRVHPDRAVPVPAPPRLRSFRSPSFPSKAPAAILSLKLWPTVSPKTSPPRSAGAAARA